MKKFIFAVMGLILMLATACQKEKVVKPTLKVNNQSMAADSSGTTDPTIPPPHGK